MPHRYKRQPLFNFGRITNHNLYRFQENNESYRRGSPSKQNSKLFKPNARYYLGDYEEEEKPDGKKRKIHYLSGGNGLAGIYVEDDGNGQLYYAYTDYLGSLTVLTDKDGKVEERQAFYPWGNRREPDDWTSLITTPVSNITGRGYTMHEHLDGFALINMNGRVYDPQIARFLSPDPILQEPGYWLNYNRYGYCLNNPLIYTDPSGYTWKIFEPFVNAWDWFWDTANQSARFLQEKGISVNIQGGVNSTNGFYTESGGHRQYANQIGVDPAQQVNNRINKARGREAYVSENSSLADVANGGGWNDGVSLSMSSDIAFPTHSAGLTIGVFIGSKDAGGFLTVKKGKGVMVNGYSGDFTYYRSLSNKPIVFDNLLGSGVSHDFGFGMHGASISWASDLNKYSPSPYAAATYSLSGPYSLQTGYANYQSYTLEYSFGGDGRSIVKNALNLGLAWFLLIVIEL